MKPTGLNTVFSTSVMTAGVVFAALGVSPDAHAQSSCGSTTTKNADGTTTTTVTPCASPPAPTPAPGGSSSGNSTGDVINNNDVKIKQSFGIGGLGPAASQLGNCYYITGFGFGFQTPTGGSSVNWSNDAKEIPDCNEAMLKRIFVERALVNGNPALMALAARQVFGKEGLNFLETEEGKAAVASFANAAAPTAYRDNQGAPAPTLVVRVETPPPACRSDEGSGNKTKAVKSRTQVTHRSCEPK